LKACLSIHSNAQIVLHGARGGRPAAAETEGVWDARVVEVDSPSIQKGYLIPDGGWGAVGGSNET
jgi:hypothetical protein